MTGRTAFIDGLLAEVFLGYKANARTSVHNPRYHPTITLPLADRRDWRDTRAKWPLARNSDKSLCQRHTSSKLFGRSPSSPFLTAVRSYRPHLEEWDPIWGDDWSHSLHRVSLSWGFPGFSSVVMQMPGDLCTDPVSSHYHLISHTWLMRQSGQVALARNPDKSWC